MCTHRILVSITGLFILLSVASCQQSAKTENEKATPAATAVFKDSSGTTTPGPMADAATILKRKQVPVLCYHHIRPFKPGESERMKSYSVTPDAFAEQMKALHDSGYQTVLPDQLYQYLVSGKPLPAKPIMLTYDDTDEEQFSIGKIEMDKYGFKGVYFIMTISINRPRYMSKEQIKQLADEGHAVECHTWDHHMVTKYTTADWDTQIVATRKKIEGITGKTVKYFAYPFGIWNAASLPEVQQRNYQMAFCLSGKRDSSLPLYTVRRMIVPGTWSTSGMFKAMDQTFSRN